MTSVIWQDGDHQGSASRAAVARRERFDSRLSGNPADGVGTDEHVRIHGKGGSVRTVLLDDRCYVTLLKLYLTRAGHTAGPQFRASINGRGGPLSYDAAHHRRQTYCAAAKVEIDIHQLRHAHATELINAGVSIEAVRRRLGHASAETTQLYALLDDKVADTEIRAARRRRDQAAH
ncbi:tyrosine-type recombinase/integrase [Spongiactinospora rosea]|uniref:tyrosine-type recombinase/integrase n=1 Tax=Spongiactinospora rosea TaxID=2248750 RepID=UPI001CECD347|nr:tyrosine-type recombinase/integrase [Spongiactinospora rosea]